MTASSFSAPGSRMIVPIVKSSAPTTSPRKSGSNSALLTWKRRLAEASRWLEVSSTGSDMDAQPIRVTRESTLLRTLKAMGAPKERRGRKRREESRGSEETVYHTVLTVQYTWG